MAEDVYKLGRYFVGSELSEDYSLLWELIIKGYRIPAFILYSDEYEEPIYDLLEVKINPISNRHSIGYRGTGYESFDRGREAFIKDCTRIKLMFQKPISSYEPHELRKLAHALEEAKRSKDFPEDYDYIT